ncbi:anthranilate synthase component II [Pontibacter oryzae]|uniref:Aminodeoxychorismate/anthranilate synthase component II n=1 Tax=Pontibacter oryzae TaxID=2304593 RepID=A0A399S450_9BACT|nr:aminodeoxychorismate/anthranilate synthase component II [Pontibacter oryzae]RIJ37309.1 aminodeoxychorismate/anthranilate synthase component II [Pontibacter oryzae]
MLLLLDNFDSFTYNLVDYFGRLGVEVQVVRNDVPLEQLKQLPVTGIVLSPGPGTPKAAGNMMEVIHYYHTQIPMLGICLGHQALGEFFEAKLEKGIKPMHGKISEISCAPDPLFENLPATMPVVRYHSLVLHHLPDCLVPLAHTQEGELMAFRHRELPLYALQFHPEAQLTTYGLHMLQNWVSIVNIAHQFDR